MSPSQCDAGQITISSKIPGATGLLPFTLLVGIVAYPTRRQHRQAAIYARYSTDEQNDRSVEDQIGKCQEFLKKGDYGEPEVAIFFDRGISGRKRSRPGIDELRSIIENRRCDLLIVEDLSRLFRKSLFTWELLGKAVDKEVRVVTTDGLIDTADPKWKILAHIASLLAELSVIETASRIRRSIEGRWRDGFTVNGLLPGYIRIPVNPSANGAERRGPYRDVKDEQCTPVITEMFERVARGENSWQVAKFLNESGLPFPQRAKSRQWTGHLVLRYVRQPMLVGKETYRRTFSTSLEVTGEVRQLPTPEDLVLHRDMPHLARLPLWLWQKANDAITKRRKGFPASGVNHPNAGIPRNSWQPFSNLLFCGVCGAKIYKDGAGYRCADSRSRPTLKRQGQERCWNRCSPQPGIVHAQIGASIVAALLEKVGQIDVIKSEIERAILEGDGTRKKRLAELERQRTIVDTAIQKLVKAIESAPDSTGLIEQLRRREQERRDIDLAIPELMQAAPTTIPLPTTDDLVAEIEKLKPRLLEAMGREAGAILRQLVDRIEVRPYQAINSGRIVLKAHFGLSLIRLLPSEWRHCLEQGNGIHKTAKLESIATIPMEVDLFESPSYVRHALEVERLRQEGLTLAQVCERLPIERDVAKQATKLARLLRSRGLNDPYVPLDEAPKTPSRRWRV